jgi:hypothetical protein
MELMYLQRAKADPAHGGKWLARAERWHELGKQELAWRFQRRTAQQQMYAGPMAMGPNTVMGDIRGKQQG